MAGGSRLARLALLAVLLGFARAAAAQDEGGPDLGFLEYLGSWQESDEDWVVVAETDDEALANAAEKAREERGRDGREGRDARDARHGRDRTNDRDGDEDEEADESDED